MKNTWSHFIVFLVVFFINSCKSPNYKQLVGEWNIDEFHVVIKDQHGNLRKDTMMQNCGKFVFYKVDDFDKKENKGKIKGYVEKPVYIGINGGNTFVKERQWFEGNARKPQMVDSDIEFWFSGLTSYEITERKGNTLHISIEIGYMYKEALIITKK